MPELLARLTYGRHVVLASVVLALAIWLSTGTMAPYAATLEYPRVIEPCHYLVNTDHAHFVAVYAMIAGAPPEYWAWSVVLRRLLFPVLSYPFVLLTGVLTGGFIASVIINVLALIAFTAFVRNRIGSASAVVVAWLIATYPGITYWAGLPYSYVMIVPGSLFGFMLLQRIIDAREPGVAIRAGLLLGLVFTGYDLLPFYGGAVVPALLIRRRFKWLLPVVAALLLPNLVIALMFTLMRVPLVNTNTGNYFVIINAWLHPFHDVSGWASYVGTMPLVLITNFVFSNLVVLPLLLGGAWLIARRRGLAVVSLAEGTLLVATLALFVFLNAAPPYDGWQLRGHWMARLYQPVLPAYLMIIARVTQGLTGTAATRWRLAIALAITANASIAFGPVLMNPLAGWVYRGFYMHSPPEALLVNLRRFGRRPLGFCSASHEWDGIKDPNTPLNRPRFMYRYTETGRR